MKFDIKELIEKAKKNKTATLIIAGAIVLLILICVIAGATSKNGKPTVAFYNISGDTEKNIETVIEGLKNEKGKQLFKVNFVTLDSEIPLSEQKKTLKKVDMLIATDGLNVRNLNVKYPYNESLLNDMTSSMQTAKGVSTKSKSVAKLPLLLDHLELTIDRTVMSETNVDVLASWSNIENFCGKAKEVVGTPLIFGGANELFVLDLIGAFCESISGKENYEKAAKMIEDELKKANKKGETPNYIKLAQSLAEKKGAPLYDGISYMNKLFHDGCFSATSFSLNETMVFAYMEADTAAIIPQFLSSHRKAPINALKRYNSFYFVSNIAAKNRSFTAPMICAVPLSKNKTARDLAANLVSASTQESLSRYTGLAPVLTNSPTPDKEADDVRFWVTATNPPLNGLSNDAFVNKSQARELEKMLVNYIVR